MKQIKFIHDFENYTIIFYIIILPKGISQNHNSAKLYYISYIKSNFFSNSKYRFIKC